MPFCYFFSVKHFFTFFSLPSGFSGFWKGHISYIFLYFSALPAFSYFILKIYIFYIWSIQCTLRNSLFFWPFGIHSNRSSGNFTSKSNNCQKEPMPACCDSSGKQDLSQVDIWGVLVLVLFSVPSLTRCFDELYMFCHTPLSSNEAPHDTSLSPSFLGVNLSFVIWLSSKAPFPI